MNHPLNQSVRLMGDAPEKCKNPWNKACANMDIELYTSYEGEEIPICSEYWQKLSESEVEW